MPCGRRHPALSTRLPPRAVRPARSGGRHTRARRCREQASRRTGSHRRSSALLLRYAVSAPSARRPPAAPAPLPLRPQAPSQEPSAGRDHQCPPGRLVRRPRAPDLRIVSGDDATASLRRTPGGRTARGGRRRAVGAFLERRPACPAWTATTLRSALGADQYDAVAKSGALAITGIGHFSRRATTTRTRHGRRIRAAARTTAWPMARPADRRTNRRPTRRPTRSAQSWKAQDRGLRGTSPKTPFVVRADDIARRLRDYYGRMPRRADEIGHAKTLHLGYDPRSKKFRVNEIDSGPGWNWQDLGGQLRPFDLKAARTSLRSAAGKRGM